MLHIQRSRLLASAVPEYILRHQPTRIWPELIDAVRQAGFSQYIIVHDGPELYCCVEVEDTEIAAEVLASSPVASRWLDSLKPFMDVKDHQRPWQHLDTVFDLTWSEFQ